jgi:hypothetical protein
VLHRIVRIGTVIVGLSLSLVASAGYNTTVTGTITNVSQFTAAQGLTAGTFGFQVSGQPNVTACGGRGSYFIVSSTSIPDAQTRTNIYALLLTAYTSGAQVEVGYDNTGGFCDQTGIGVYWIETP